MLTSSSLRLRTSCVRLNPPQLTITSPKSFGVNVLHPALRFHRQQICIPASIAIDQQRRGGYVNYRVGSRNHLGTQRNRATLTLTGLRRTGSTHRGQHPEIYVSRSRSELFLLRRRPASKLVVTRFSVRMANCYFTSGSGQRHSNTKSNRHTLRVAAEMRRMLSRWCSGTSATTAWRAVGSRSIGC